MATSESDITGPRVNVSSHYFHPKPLLAEGSQQLRETHVAATRSSSNRNVLNRGAVSELRISSRHQNTPASEHWLRVVCRKACSQPEERQREVDMLSFMNALLATHVGTKLPSATHNEVRGWRKTSGCAKRNATREEAGDLSRFGMVGGRSAILIP